MKALPSCAPMKIELPKTTFSGLSSLSTSSFWKDLSVSAHGAGSGADCGASDVKTSCARRRSDRDF
jgi:hypothetical protein